MIRNLFDLVRPILMLRNETYLRQVVLPIEL
jgi:hypothetical protein